MQKIFTILQPYEKFCNFIAIIYRNKDSEEQFNISKPRNFLSYCHELCGKLNIPLRYLKFQINGGDVEFDKKVRSSCIIQVYGNREVPPMTDSLLKQSLIKLRRNDQFSDIIININGTQIKVI